MKTIRTTAALAIIVAIVCPFLSAQETTFKEKDYFAVAGEAVTLVAVEPGGDAVPPKPSPLRPRSGGNKTAGGLANAGVTTWNVINSGAPSGSYSSAYASAIPGFMFNWGNVIGWKGPKEMVYRYKATNLMGIDVIDVKYKISFFYGGTEDYEGETPPMNRQMAQAHGHDAARDTPTASKVHGRYITNFTVQPVSVNVKWGWKFDLAVRMSDPINLGTKMNPVAALQASLNWIRATPFTSDGGTLTYNVDGLGNFTDLTQKEKDLTGEISPVQISESPTIPWN